MSIGGIHYTPANLSTANTDLAAALTALGIPLNRFRNHERLTGDIPGGEKYVWFFEPASQCGKYVTTAMMAAWHEEGWEDRPENAEHPLAYLKCAAKNKFTLVGMIKTGNPVGVIAGKHHTALISLDMPQSKQDKVLRWLK